MDDEKLGEFEDVFHRAVKVVTKYLQAIDGTIFSVDEDEFTCSVTVSDSTSSIQYDDVPLRVLIGSQASVIEIPVVGTNCVIFFRDGVLGRPQLAMVHEVDKLLLNCNQIIANNGNNGGLINIVDLVKDVNSIKDDVNKLKTIFSSGWVVVPNDGGAALKAAAASWAGDQLPETDRSDYEDTTILH